MSNDQNEPANSERHAFTVDDDVFRPRGGSRNLLKLPSLVLSSIRLTYQAGPWLFVLTTALEFAQGLGAGAQLLLGKAVLDITLRPQQSTSAFRQAFPELLALFVITIGLAFAQAIQVEESKVQGELVARLAYDRILDVSEAVELAAFESPVFFDQLQRALVNGTARPYQMVSGLTSLVTSGLTILAVCGVIISLEPIVLPLALLAYLPLWLAVLRNSRSYYEFMFDMTKLNRQRFYLLRILTARDEAKEIRAFALGPLLRRRFGDFYDKYIQGLKGIAVVRIKRAVLASLATSGVSVGALALLAYLYLDNQVSLAAAGTIVAALLQLSSRLQSFTSGVGSLYEGALFLDNYQSFVAILPEVASSRPSGVAPSGFDELAVERVSFSYPGTDVYALREVSLNLKRGEMIALVGANGSGKTTLAKILANLYSPTSGRVLWDGLDVATMEPEGVRDSVTVVFQDFARYLMSARDNITAGRYEVAENTERLYAAARAAAAEGFILRLPGQYDALLGKEFEGGQDLSVGQWQRVALARAFFRQAPFVILDEPTSALDPRAESDLFEHIRTLLEGRSVLVISHRFSSVRSADRIYVLKDGEVIEQGRHVDLMAHNGVYAELFSLQASAYVDGRPADDDTLEAGGQIK